MRKNIITKINIRLRFTAATLFGMGLLLSSVTGALAQTPTPSPSPGVGTAAATTYQFPCAPYTTPYYAFGQYVSGWGYHVAEDTCNAAGIPVYAAAEGTVMYSAKTPDSYRWGNLVVIQHTQADGGVVSSVYGHLSADRRVAAGQTVAKGQLIGFTGPAWTAENGNWAAHLHFGIRGGAYGASAGTYTSWVVGYQGSGTAGWYRPSDYVNARLQPPAPAEVYDYAVESVQSIGDQNGKYNEYYVDFRLRNTGNQTWRINGTAPMKLGTINPNDRPSAFSNGQLGQGWSSPTRIALMADTAPGEVGIFRGRFSNDTIAPGQYVERFAPVLEGVKWLPNRNIQAVITINPPRESAQWGGQSSHFTSDPAVTTSNFASTQYLAPGQKVNLKVILWNRGDSPWWTDGNTPVRLGTNRPTDRPSAWATGGDGSIPTSENWEKYNRPSKIDGRIDVANGAVTPTNVINPGEAALFSWTVTAPSQPGIYREYVRPVIENIQWLEDQGIFFELRVLPPGYHYEYAGQTNPSPVAMGDGGRTTEVLLRNSGQAAWPVGGNVKLGTDRGQDRPSAFKGNDWLSSTRPSAVDGNASNPGQATVGPGQIAKFSFNVDNPSQPDRIYPEYFKPLVEGVTWMPEDYGMFVPVTVQSPALKHRVVSQTYDKDVYRLRPNDLFSSTIAVQNLGSETWQAGGSNPVKLGTARPNDRPSGFAQLVGSDPWASLSRPSLIDGKTTSLNPVSVIPTTEVRQGEIAVFQVPMRVPTGLPIGPYNEYVNLVKEGQSWFSDIGIYFPIQLIGSLL